MSNIIEFPGSHTPNAPAAPEKETRPTGMVATAYYWLLHDYLHFKAGSDDVDAFVAAIHLEELLAGSERISDIDGGYYIPLHLIGIAQDMSGGTDDMLIYIERAFYGDDLETDDTAEGADADP